MADAGDLKSPARKGVWVQSPPLPILARHNVWLLQEVKHMARKSVRPIKATFNIREDLWGFVRDAVAQKTAPSKNALIERALEHERDSVKRGERLEALKRAMRDPLFLKDLRDVERDFAPLDAEIARQIR